MLNYFQKTARDQPVPLGDSKRPSARAFFMRMLLVMAIVTWSQLVVAQSFQLRYTTTTSGAVTFTGNTLGLAKLSGQNQPGALDSIGGFITLNTSSQLGNYP